MDNVVNCRTPRPHASMRLFCFAWAGGSSDEFSEWSKILPDDIEVIALRRRGKNNNYFLNRFNSVEEMVTETVAAIADRSDKPFAIFGHSLGGLLSFLVAERLRSQHNIEPVHMFISGCAAIHSDEFKQRQKEIAVKSEEEFIQMLKKLGGTPDEIFENQQLMQMIFPYLKSEYNLLSELSYSIDADNRPLSCPLTICIGKEDVFKDSSVKQWSEVTTGPFQQVKFNGGHFYLQDKDTKKKLCDLVSNTLYELDYMPA
ncbi:unnamed protein product [Owenia fusiformis]|uniref:oleoyl-[acyl-carrier-protein] hydrolase n=1 Tax=Owenia fusiformis TaxID=6347 RepID=A0A8S4PUR1_OWEFU|nr:unnamed protein product [Owenia fusiformis]